jgi:hypothetical protein
MKILGSILKACGQTKEASSEVFNIDVFSSGYTAIAYHAPKKPYPG